MSMTLTKPSIQMRPYQLEVHSALDDFHAEGGRRGVVNLPTGCHAKGQGILLYNGQVKAVEDIQVGDRLMGPDSRPRTVLRLARGEEEMVDVQPKKGKPWRVNRSHILTLVRTKERNGERGGYPSMGGGSVVDIPIPEWEKWSRYKKHVHKLFRASVDFEDRGPVGPLSPYVLGILLGDGGLSIDGRVSYTKPDKEVIAIMQAEAERFGVRVRSDGITHHLSAPNRGGKTNPIVQAIRDLNLSGTRSEDKFIPTTYKTASRSERLELLAGLIDSDGSYSGSFDFLSKSVRLAEDTAFVARSLGLAAYLKPKKVQGHTFYRVSISGDLSCVPTKIPRKQAQPRQQKKDVLRTGFEIVPTGTVEPYYGFTLTGDGRYLLDDFTVTHNTGKTITGLDYARKKGGRLLWLAHRDELITQPIRAMQAVWPEASTGIVKAKQNEMNAQCVFATVQSLYRRLDQLPTLGPDDLVVVDECHHAAADTYRQTLEAAGALRPDGPPVVGLTATVERGDRRGLDDVFEKIVYQYQLLQAIRDGYLVDLKTERIHLNLDLDEIHTVAGDFNQGELDDALLQAGVAQAVANAYIEHASDRKAIVFTVSVDQAQRTAEALQSQGVAAEWVAGILPTEERRAILQRLKTGETQVVVNCMVLTEGFDEPTVECVIVARPTKSRPLYIQMIGRGTRKAPGKRDCLVLDVTGVSRRHELMTAPTLFGLKETEPGETITEALDREEDEEKAQRNTEANRLRSIFDEEDNEFQEFRQMIRWLNVGSDIYALSAGEAGTVVLHPAGDGYQARVLKPNQPDEYLTKAPVWLELAQGVAEDYLRRASTLGLIRTDARWKSDPATANQLRLLEKFRIYPGRPLTKGEAGDEITKAIVRWKLRMHD